MSGFSRSEKSLVQKIDGPKTGPIFFEGGTQERDKVEWMIEYDKREMYPLKDELSYDIVDSRFPGLSVL